MSTVIQFPTADPRPLSQRVSEEVRALMGRHGISQFELAHWMGIDQTSVSARLRNKTEWKVAEIQRVAEGFGVHPSVLFGGRSDGPAPDGGHVLIPRGVRRQGFEPRTQWLRAGLRPLAAA